MEEKSRPIRKQQPLGVTAYHKIYQKIISLEFEPGQSLEEKRLMKQLDLGRTPIREALLRLAGENMVESQPGKGFVVRSITLQNVKSTFEMMKLLETGAVDLMVRQDPTPFIGGMAAASEAVKSAVFEKDVLALVEANHDFHLHYARCSRNDYLIRWINEIRSEAKRLAYLSYANEMDPGISLSDHYRSVIREHDEMITLLEAKDADNLKKTVIEHINAFQRRIILFMST